MDQEKKCSDCGQMFVVEEGELRWMEKMGFTPPKRCPECRRIKKEKHNEKK